MISYLLACFVIVLIVFLGKLFWVWLRWFKDSSYAENHSFLSACFHKGASQEMKISRLCDKALAPSYTIANPYIETIHGETTEIDILFLTTKGIFVIESKNYSGWIFGKETDHKFTQTLPQGKGRKSQSYQFFNPILQNEHHIKVLKESLLDKEIYHSVLVFSDACTLKNVTYHKERCTILYLSSLKGYLKKLKAYPDVCSVDELMRLYQRIHPMSMRSEAYKQGHIDAIKKKHKH